MRTVSIKGLIEKRAAYPIGFQIGDEWVDEILETNPDNAFLISTFNLHLLAGMGKREKRQQLFERYNIVAIFGLSNPMHGTAVDLMLLVLRKGPSEKVLVGNYTRKLYTSNSYRLGLKAGETVPIDIYPIQFEEYCSKIESWIEQGEPGTNGMDYWFNEIQAEDLDIKNINPLPYSKKCFEVREFLRCENTKPLSEFAEVIKPRPIGGETGKVIGIRDFHYPLNISRVKEGLKTDTELKVGDILFKNGIPDKYYLLLEQPIEPIFAGANDFVIRTTNLNLSAYILQYFISDVGKTVIEASSSGMVLLRISLRSLRDLPIIEPKNPLSHYLETFLLLTTKPKDISTYNEWIAAASKHQDVTSIEDVLNVELLENAKLYKGDMIREFLMQDFAELNACYKAKAYKATLIMCGSILEAVLIDWASEYDQKDYFNEDMIVKDRRTGTTKRADLIDYIDKIKEINRPKWMT